MGGGSSRLDQSDSDEDYQVDNFKKSIKTRDSSKIEKPTTKVPKIKIDGIFLSDEESILFIQQLKSNVINIKGGRVSAQFSGFDLEGRAYRASSETGTIYANEVYGSIVSNCGNIKVNGNVMKNVKTTTGMITVGF